MNYRLFSICIVIAFVLYGCDDTNEVTSTSVETPPAESTSQDDEIRDACYHYEIEGALRDTSTCRSHKIDADDRGALTIDLQGEDTTVILEMPVDLEVDQYGFDNIRDDDLARAKVVEHASDAAYIVSQSGTLTIMRYDDEAISALFDFEATFDSADSPQPVQVRGHLRDLTTSE